MVMIIQWDGYDCMSNKGMVMIFYWAGYDGYVSSHNVIINGNDN